MPTIGRGTLESLRAAGAAVLAIEAGRTILVDLEDLAAYARRSGITIVSLCDQAGMPALDAAA
jgi:DUF1009 family protein